MLKRKIRIQLDTILNELTVNLENNYKDLAHDALKKLRETLESYYAQGEIKERDYQKYKKIVDEYTVKMADYHH